jgi:hypothetical protein
MQHIIALSRIAVIVRHWFEIDLDDSSMEHGVRIELRELPARPRRGSESAAQVITADRPLWRADLFDRHTDTPGTFGVAHFHPSFLGIEPCPRVFEPELTASPFTWLGHQFAALGATGGRDAWDLERADADELSGMSAAIVLLARTLGPDQCGSAAQCYALTRDAREAVRVMLATLRQPGRLDTEWTAPWRAADPVSS